MEQENILEKYRGEEKRVLKCQSVVRNYLWRQNMKRVDGQLREIEAQQRERKDSKEMAEEIGKVDLKVGYDMWEKVLEFMGLSGESIINFGLVSRGFYQIIRMNHLWYLAFKRAFPLVYEEKKGEEDYRFNNCDWKGELKKQYLMQREYQ